MAFAKSIWERRPVHSPLPPEISLELENRGISYFQPLEDITSLTDEERNTYYRLRQGKVCHHNALLVMKGWTIKFRYANRTMNPDLYQLKPCHIDTFLMLYNTGRFSIEQSLDYQNLTKEQASRACHMRLVLGILNDLALQFSYLTDTDLENYNILIAYGFEMAIALRVCDKPRVLIDQVVQYQQDLLKQYTDPNNPVLPYKYTPFDREACTMTWHKENEDIRRDNEKIQAENEKNGTDKPLKSLMSDDKIAYLVNLQEEAKKTSLKNFQIGKSKTDALIHFKIHPFYPPPPTEDQMSQVTTGTGKLAIKK